MKELPWKPLTVPTNTASQRMNFKGAPLTKARILDVYSDICTGIGKFPGELYKFQLKENAKPMMHA